MTTPITTIPQLEAVPVGHVVRSAAGTIAARFDHDRGVVFGDNRPFPWTDLGLPVTVLWPLPEPTVKPGRDALARAVHDEQCCDICPPDPEDYELAVRLLAAAPGKSEQEVRADALRDAKTRIAHDFTFSGHEVAAWLDALAADEAGQ